MEKEADAEMRILKAEISEFFSMFNDANQSMCQSLKSIIRDSLPDDGDKSEGIMCARVRKLFQGRSDLIHKFNEYLLREGHKIIPMLDGYEQTPRTIPVELAKAALFIDKIKLRFGESGVCESLVPLLESYIHQTKSKTVVCEQAAQLFQNHPDVCDEFADFILDISFTALMFHENTRSEGIELLEKVAEKLPILEDYFSFLTSLTSYSNNSIDQEELYSMVGSLLQNFPDLMFRLEQYLAISENKGHGHKIFKADDSEMDLILDLCFKKCDMKSLSTEALLEEIRKTYENKQKEGGDFLAAIGNKLPRMEFEYTDPEIHEDIFQLVGYYCQRVCTPQKFAIIKKMIWAAFLDPILDVPPYELGTASGEEGYKFLPSKLTHAPPASPYKQRKTPSVFYGNESYYLMFRLHQILYERLKLAKSIAATKKRKWTTSLKEKRPNEHYERFLSSLSSVLDGSIDHGEYELECLSLFRTQFLPILLSALDDVIHRLVDKIQVIVSGGKEGMLLFLHQTSRRSLILMYEELYRSKARAALRADEKLYRFGFTYAPTRVAIELMGNAEKEKSDEVVADNSVVEGNQ